MLDGLCAVTPGGDIPYDFSANPVDAVVIGLGTNNASALELPHPTAKGETIKAHSPLPADFRATLKLFGMGKR